MRRILSCSGIAVLAALLLAASPLAAAPKKFASEPAPAPADAGPMDTTVAYTDPLGGMVVSLVAGADNLIGIPFSASQEYAGEVFSVTALGGDLYQIDLGISGSPGAGNLWANLYYVRFTTGAAAGKYFTITASDDISVTVDSNGDDLSTLAIADALGVHKYWTLATLFPPGVQTALVVSTGNLGFQRGSEVLLPDQVGTGINRAPTYKYFVTSTEWRDTVAFQNSNNVILYPDSYIIIRQKSTAGARSLVLSGAVPMSSHTIDLLQTTVSNDNYLCVGRPVPVALQDLGLGTEFLNSTGNLGFQRGDELLIWVNPTGINPAPNKKFYRVNTEWRDSATFAPSNTYLIQPGAAMIIRKKAQATTLTKFWTNQPGY